jgi:NAD(P)-dependent dehydrogenase (short-subunit alcohol dehydrogenase family)
MVDGGLIDDVNETQRHFQRILDMVFVVKVRKKSLETFLDDTTTYSHLSKVAKTLATVTALLPEKRLSAQLPKFYSEMSILKPIWTIITALINIFYALLMDRNVYRVNLKSIAGKIVIVTGSNAGVGRAAAEKLYRAGAHVIMACRNEKLAHEAIESIKESNKISSGNISFFRLDLSELSTVESFVQNVASKFNHIDAVICNAGLNGSAITKDGLEQQFQVNYLGHFLLTKLIINRFGKTGKSIRFVNLSSTAHHFGKTDFESASIYQNHLKVYADSKLYMNLLTYQTNKLYASNEEENPIVSSVAVNPGFVHSDIWRNWTGLRGAIISVVLRASLTTDEGSETSLYGAIADWKEIIGATNKFSIANPSNNRGLFGHRLIPYVVPYAMPSPAIGHEIAGRYNGPTFTLSTIPKNIDDLAGKLWDFSKDLCEKKLSITL